MKRIQLAIGNDDFANILRMHLVEAGFDVLANDAYHRNFLSDLLELEQPHMVILHDTFLPSEAETQEANEHELLQLLNVFRMQYNDSMRFVVLSEREKNDPFLKSLVAHNVLDIFTGRQIPTSVLINQLSESPKYQNVAKHGVGQLVEHLNENLIPDEETVQVIDLGSEVDNARAFNVRETFTKSKEYLTIIKKRMKPKNASIEFEPMVEIELEQEPEREKLDTSQVTESIEANDKPEPLVRFTQTRKEHRKVKKVKPQESNNILESKNVTISPSVVVKDRFIGTVFLAVTSLGANIGATHTSILLATYLHRQGYKVALVEGNRSGDFHRLHELFGEGSMSQPFTIHDIDHFAFTDEQSFHPFFHDYQFVIMDLGNSQSSPWFNEFFRAQKRFLVAGYADWKLSLIGDFIKKNGKIPFQVVVPFGDQELIRDLYAIYEDSTTFCSMPFHRNPYELQADSHAVLTELYGQLTGANVKQKSRHGLWLGVASVLAVTTLGLSVYLFT